MYFLMSEDLKPDWVSDCETCEGLNRRMDTMSQQNVDLICSSFDVHCGINDGNNN